MFRGLEYSVMAISFSPRLQASVTSKRPAAFQGMKKLFPLTEQRRQAPLNKPTSSHNDEGVIPSTNVFV